MLYGSELYLGGILRDCLPFCFDFTLFRRCNCLPKDSAIHFLLIEKCLRNIVGTDGGAVTLARYYEDWRASRHCKCTGKSIESGLHKTLSRHSQEPSCHGKYIHEHCFQHARTRQCGHTDGTESHATDAGT